MVFLFLKVLFFINFSSRIMQQDNDSHHDGKCSAGIWQTYNIMDAQSTNLQELRDALMSIWSKISEE